MANNWLKVTCSLGLVVLFTLVSVPEKTYAQWPPFYFKLLPSFEQNRITYNIQFSTNVDWPMSNIIVKIPLPKGTRFLEAKAWPATDVNFDGAEITFFTAFYSRPVNDALFVVEITDPDQTVFTTHAWIAWEGGQPGDYLTQDFSIDITHPPANWKIPVSARLLLKATATAANGIITYAIYPTNIGRLRMWDLKINVPLPEGSTFLSAQATPSFTANFNGQEVTFSTIELERQVENLPLILTVSATKATTPFLVTHVWATWKNVGGNVGRSIEFQEETRSGDIIVQPQLAQQVVSDRIGDVPFTNYDLTSIAMQNEEKALKITFYLTGEVGPPGEPFIYTMYVDKDCRVETGQLVNDLGRDYRVRYRNDKHRASFSIWDETAYDFVVVEWLDYEIPANEKLLSIWVPNNLLENSQSFCWQADTEYWTENFSSTPPTDLTISAHYQVITSTVITVANPVMTESSPGNVVNSKDSTALPPTEAASIQNNTVIPTESPIHGKLAIPLDNGWATYDLHIFSMPAGQETMRITNARQPHFRPDGQRLLMNQEGDGVENVFEYNLLDGTKRQVSDGPKDSHPYYDSGANRFVFDNPELIIGANGLRGSFIFVQCGLMPPHLETEPRCQDISSLGVLVPAGQMGEIQGTHPVWTSNDMIAYKGCNTWAGARLCGIYIVPSSSTKGLSDGFIPRQLTSDTSDIPADTRGNFITFTSQRDGNWEAYVMDLNGNGIKNLSNSPNSDDGLPAISPDGYWVAFLSDRGGQWAVWAVPIVGGDVQKLFDLPTNQPWGDGDRTWTNERISWGQ